MCTDSTPCHRVETLSVLSSNYKLRHYYFIDQGWNRVNSSLEKEENVCFGLVRELRCFIFPLVTDTACVWTLEKALIHRIQHQPSSGPLSLWCWFKHWTPGFKIEWRTKYNFCFNTFFRGIKYTWLFIIHDVQSSLSVEPVHQADWLNTTKCVCVCAWMVVCFYELCDRLSTCSGCTPKTVEGCDPELF